MNTTALIQDYYGATRTFYAASDPQLRADAADTMNLIVETIGDLDTEEVNNFFAKLTTNVENIRLSIHG